MSTASRSRAEPVRAQSVRPHTHCALCLCPERVGGIYILMLKELWSWSLLRSGFCGWRGLLGPDSPVCLFKVSSKIPTSGSGWPPKPATIRNENSKKLRIFFKLLCPWEQLREKSFPVLLNLGIIICTWSQARPSSSFSQLEEPN